MLHTTLCMNCTLFLEFLPLADLLFITLVVFKFDRNVISCISSKGVLFSVCQFVNLEVALPDNTFYKDVARSYIYATVLPDLCGKWFGRLGHRLIGGCLTLLGNS